MVKYGISSGKSDTMTCNEDTRERGGDARLNMGAEVKLRYYKHSDIALTSFSAETLYLSSYCCDDPRTKEPPCDDE